MTALAEELIGMGLLEVAGADLGARNVGGDGKHRNLVAVRIEEPVDEVQVAGAAAAGADGKLSGQFGVGGGVERRGRYRELHGKVAHLWAERSAMMGRAPFSAHDLPMASRKWLRKRSTYSCSGSSARALMKPRVSFPTRYRSRSLPSVAAS